MNNIRNDKIRTTRQKFNEKVIDSLIDEIFHITSYKNYLKIIKEWYIENNFSLKNTTTTSHSTNSRFYKRWYISLFDWRKHKRKNRDTLYEWIMKFLPRAKIWNKYVVLFLSKEYYKNIKEYSRKSANKNWEMMIPLIEVWYKKKIPIKFIYKTTTIIINERKHIKWWLVEINKILGKFKQ